MLLRATATIGCAVFVLTGAPASFAQSSSDAGSSPGKAESSSPERTRKRGSLPDRRDEMKFSALLGRPWGNREGCNGDWKVIWKVAGGTFSLVPGTGSGVAGASAHHAVCHNFRSVGDIAPGKVGLTVIGGVIRRVAVLPGGSDGAKKVKSEIVAYLGGICGSEEPEASAEAFQTLYEDCGGYDVGLAGGSSDLSMYFFGDYSGFRGRMNALPMPTKPSD